MILTFEVIGEHLQVHLDADGRDQLIALLAELREPVDHKHLFRLEGVTRAGITHEQFDAGSVRMLSTELWLIDSSVTPIPQEGKEE